MSFKRLLTIIIPVLCGSLSAAYIGYLYPAGGRAGSEVEILVGGQGLVGVRSVILTGGGISDVVCENVPGMPVPSSSQRRYLHRWVRQIEKGDRSFLPLPTGENATIDWHHSAWYSKLNELSALQYELVTQFLFIPRNSLQMSPSIAQRVIVRFKIAPDASPGRRELRLAGGSWISNPMPFYIGKAPEFAEPRYQPPPSKKKNGSFTWPCVLNGQIRPGETDCFDFEAKKGDVMYFDLKGRVLQPFLGDGVPGHFQAVLEVTDENGSRLAFADDRYFDPDPVLRFEAPATGRYRLLVRDALYRGREDFVYRIEIDGNPRPYRMLPPPEFAVTPVKFEEQVGKDVCLSIPSVVEDVLPKAGACRAWSFRAEKGETIVADVWARRLASPVDALLEIFGPDGKRICVCDDVRRPRIGLVMQHMDPTVMFTAPVSGRYRAVVRDNAGAGGPDYRYYLRIDRPRPDFRAYGCPSVVECGGIGIFSVVVERRDGFSGPVKIALRNPDGYRIVGENTVPAGCERAFFTLDGSSAKRGQRQTFRLEASDGNITRPVVPGTEAMQAFAYTHLIPCEGDFYVTRNGRYWASRYFSWKEKTPPAIKLYPGSRTVITLKTANPKYLPAEFTFTGMALHEQPQGVLIEDVKYEKEKGQITATIRVAADAKPITVNQIFVCSMTFRERYKDRKTGQAKYRKSRASGLLPARRLIVEAPAAGK